MISGERIFILPISHDVVNYLDIKLQHLFYNGDNLSIAWFFVYFRVRFQQMHRKLSR